MLQQELLPPRLWARILAGLEAAKEGVKPKERDGHGKARQGRRGAGIRAPSEPPSLPVGQPLPGCWLLARRSQDAGGGWGGGGGAWAGGAAALPAAWAAPPGPAPFCSPWGRCFASSGCRFLSILQSSAPVLAAGAPLPAPAARLVSAAPPAQRRDGRSCSGPLTAALCEASTSLPPSHARPRAASDKRLSPVNKGERKSAEMKMGQRSERGSASRARGAEVLGRRRQAGGERRAALAPPGGSPSSLLFVLLFFFFFPLI